ncbi:MAG: ECF-type riboflavin transporter substrate-binding protein [Treponema sp.]|nr:ECF-type riboflavin transporter substrate-binding protein [Treponema sp.]
MNRMISVKTVVAIGIGAALMFVLMRFVAVPTGIPNVNINLGIAVLSLFAAIFGPIAGFLIGLIGHTLVDLTWGWGVWWSWVFSSAIYGCAIGLFSKFYLIEDGEFGLKQCIIFNVVQIGANALVWGVVAPILDILIYAEPADKVFTQGIVAGASNMVVVLVLGSLLAFGYAKTRTRAGSLRRG